MGKTSIEWCDRSWNVIRGCQKVSPGCKHCYAEGIASRFSGPGLAFEGAARGGRWTGELLADTSKLLEPLRLRRPARIFVNSVSDLFWEKVPDFLINAHLAVAYLAPHHRFLCLTKRAGRLILHGGDWDGEPFRRLSRGLARCLATKEQLPEVEARIHAALLASPHAHTWPPPNWLQGVSVESEAEIARVPLLLSAGFACPWVSAEPLLGPLRLEGFMESAPEVRNRLLVEAGWVPLLKTLDGRSLEWVVIGGESGPDARPCEREWIQDLVRQAERAEVPAFVKQLGAAYVDAVNGVGGARWRGKAGDAGPSHFLKDAKGADPAEWPSFLKVRAYPAAAELGEEPAPVYPASWPLA